MSSVSLGRVGTALKQCQRCHKSETAELHLQSCAGCKRSHYCSKACQLADWSNHKQLCKANRDTRLRMKNNNDESVSGVPSVRDVEDRLKKWIQVHRPMLHYAIIHALTLQVTPDRCLTHVLSLNLVPNFTNSAMSASLTTRDFATSFHISEANVGILSDAQEDLGPHVSESFALAKAKTMAIRQRGGMGVPLMIINVPVVKLAHVTPLGCEDSLNEVDCPVNKNWERDLKEMVRRGQAF